MFKNVLLGFSLLCGFLLPNHINAYTPLVYSWETGDSATSAIVMPPLPAGYTNGKIISVATDAAGNTVMVGQAYNADNTALIPLAYRLAYGATGATQISTPFPAGYTNGWIGSVAINADGNAVMVGQAVSQIGSAGHSEGVPLAYRLDKTATEATPITPEFPDKYKKGILSSVAIDAAGNAVMVGYTDTIDESAPIFAYSWETGDPAASQITTNLPTDYTIAEILSVAINAAGKAVMVGNAWKADISDKIPVAYSWNTGDLAATQITTDLPAGYARGGLVSVAINDNGLAVMGGDANKVVGPTDTIALAYSWTNGAATRITTGLPARYDFATIKSVAVNSSGNAVMVGMTRDSTEFSQFPLAYSWTNGAASATRITTPPGDSSDVLGLNSVAINDNGLAVMVGDFGGQGAPPIFPMVYSWKAGDAIAIETPPRYHEYAEEFLYSVAITADGKAIIGGKGKYIAPNTGGAFPGGAFYQQPFQW